MDILKKGLRYSLYSIPFLVWMYLFRDFFFERAFLGADSLSVYHYIKIYLESIVKGDYPIWKPYTKWGAAQLYTMRFIGEFNPFYYIILLLKMVGVSYTKAYYVFSFAYHFLGAAGVYGLIYRFIKDHSLSYLGSIIFLFSSLSLMIFSTQLIILLLVPMIWFFYFVVSFYQEPNKLNVLGISFSLMLIAITYIPFYFLTIFLSGLILGLLFCFKEAKSFVIKLFQFILGNKRFSLFCIVAMLISLAPGLIWYGYAQTDEVVRAARQAGSSVNNVAGVAFNTADVGGIIGLITFEQMLEGILPIWLYLVLVLAIVNRLSKRMCVVFLTTTFIVLISMTGTTPVFPFLFEHVFFMKLFRNLFFLFYLCFPFMILFGMVQLKQFLSGDTESLAKRLGMISFVVAVHVVAIFFLMSANHIYISSYITIGLSALLLSLYLSGLVDQWKQFLLAGLVVVAMIQPIEVLGKMYMFEEASGRYVNDSSKIAFNYSRPKFGQPAKQAGGVQEDSGFAVSGKFHGSAKALLLQKKVSQEALIKYVQNKFVVYDEVEYLDDKDIDEQRAYWTFGLNKNTAFVADKNQVEKNSPSKKFPPTAQVITKANPKFKVIDFGLNMIKFKTNFSARKFVVYNDSYHSWWWAKVNGAKKDVARANVAFKGIWLEPGENTVVFYFGSPWLYRFYCFVALFFLGTLFYLLKLWIAPGETEEDFV